MESPRRGEVGRVRGRVRGAGGGELVADEDSDQFGEAARRRDPARRAAEGGAWRLAPLRRARQPEGPVPRVDGEVDEARRADAAGHAVLRDHARVRQARRRQLGLHRLQRVLQRPHLVLALLPPLLNHGLVLLIAIRVPEQCGRIVENDVTPVMSTVPKSRLQ